MNCGGEDRVAVIDRVLRIADQVREAELVRLGVSALRGKSVGQPDLRLGATEKHRRHAFAACRRDHVGHGRGAAERSLPPRRAFHACACFVAGDHRARAHAGGDHVGVGCERLAGARQHVGDDALRDAQAEQAVEHFGQALETHQLAAVQIGDGRSDAGAERGALGHVGRRCRGDALAAARALARNKLMRVVIGLIGGRSIWS